MKQLLFFSLLFFSTTSIFSQYVLNEGVDVFISEPYPVIDGNTDFIEMGDSLYAYKVGRDGNSYIQIFDKESLKFISKKELDKPMGHLWTFLNPDNESVKCLINVFAPEGNSLVNVSYRKFDQTNSEFPFGEEQIIHSYKPINPKAAENGLYNSLYYKDEFVHSTSHNQQIYFLSHKLKTVFMEAKKEVVQMKVFDYNFNEIWGRVVEMPYTRPQMEVLNYFLGNDGNYYNLIKYFPVVERKEEYEIQLIKFDENGTTITPIKSQFKGTKERVSIKYISGKDDQILIVGCYKTGVDNSKTGILIIPINDEGELQEEINIELPEEAMNLFSGTEKEKARSEKRDHYMVMDRASVDKNGNITIIGEDKFNADTQNNFHTLCEGFTVLQVTQQGELNWITKIPLYQDNGNGAYALFEDNKLELFCIDDPANLNLATNDKPKLSNGREGVLYRYKIDLATGKAIKTPVININEINGIPVYQFNYWRINSLSEDVYLIDFYKRKKEDVMVRVKLH